MKKSRVIIYGDIHGCLDEFIALRKKAKLTKNDIEICVGDILSKGKKDFETLQYIMKENILTIRGNNDDIFLRYKRELDAGNIIKSKNYAKTQQTLNKMGSEEFEFIQNMPFFHKIDNLTIIHGGLELRTNLETACEEELCLTTRIAYLNSQGEYIKEKNITPDCSLWADSYDAREGFIVYGHHVFDEPKESKYALGIDTGCVFGNKLTAVIFDMCDSRVNLKSLRYIFQNAYQRVFVRVSRELNLLKVNYSTFTAHFTILKSENIKSIIDDLENFTEEAQVLKYINGLIILDILEAV